MPPKSRWDNEPSPPAEERPRKKKKIKKEEKDGAPIVDSKGKEKEKDVKRQRPVEPEKEKLPERGPIRHFRPRELGLGTCRSIDEFEVLRKISAGSYGEVRKAREKETGEVVALKELKYDLRNGFPITGLREIQLLRRSMEVENVVRLIEVVEGKKEGDISLILPYHPYPLSYIIGNEDVPSPPFSHSDIKCLMHQLLSGLANLHSLSILHRDLKPSNLLLASDGTLKIADFGMARTIPALPGSQLTHPAQAFTLWYRAPELLLGAKKYGFETDIWSAGVVFAELFKNGTLFKSDRDYVAVSKIFELLGPPDDRIWKGWKSMENIKHFKDLTEKKRRGTPHEMLETELFEKEKLNPVSEETLDLLAMMLWLGPKGRLSAKECLQHEYFKEEPRMKPRAFLPTFPAVARD